MISFAKQNGDILLLLIICIAGLSGLRKNYSIERLSLFIVGLILLIIVTCF
ncbi:hypothetical protein [Clostridium combesii]|uniref:hypothetical protein n=1 Tax=Clostridium combesii TaxID=39481 RepID=UPI0013FD94B6|nr:hypothetical protein [Clostridium combesii]